MFHFQWPWFALVLPLPYFIWKLTKHSTNEKKDAAQGLYFARFEQLKKTFENSSQSFDRSKSLFYFLLGLSWFFLILALMQPERVEHYHHVTTKGYDLILAVDLSASMEALDFSTKTQKISRLDATKEVVSKFVKARQGDRVGLVTFGQSAYLHVPLTHDTLSVSCMLNDAVCKMAGNATAIGDAIGVSVRALRDRPEGSRVLVLLTDGEDNASSIPPLEAAKLAKQYGIRIYAIGIGKKGQVPFPTQFGRHVMVNVTIDEELLKNISAMTGGHYFSATDPKALESVYDKINELEKTESNQSLYLIRDPLYSYPLSLSLFFLCLVILEQFKNRRADDGV